MFGSMHSATIPMHGSDCTRSVWEQTLRAASLANNRVRVRYPRPQVTEHSDHSLHGFVAQDTSPTQSVSHESFSMRATLHPAAFALGIAT